MTFFFFVRLQVWNLPPNFVDQRGFLKQLCRYPQIYEGSIDDAGGALEGKMIQCNGFA